MGGPAATNYARVKALFEAVCDLPDADAQRAALQAQAVDEATLAEVMALLGHSGAPTRFSGPVAQAAEQWLGGELQVGDRLGPWTLLRALGEGGMGRVFLAERSDGHYQQQAAIKLLRGGSSPEALARLARERQILARLSHPHIARLLDGGATPSGRPYLVIEFADGDTLDAWCARHALGLAARLALFQTVCDAVAHAHRQLVIHCDIKPANVLVNAEGRAMLLDFGIARLETDDAQAPVALTPGYASPEQHAGLPPGTSSDIYSLGRLLDTLLAPVAATHRRGPELAAIVACATAQQPEQRYESVAALQRDLQRLLAHEAVAPLRERRAYVLRKALRRHWPWVLAGSAALLMAAGFTREVLQQRDRAQTEAATAREVSEFVVGLFNAADTAQTRWADLRAADLLERGRQRILRDLAAQPLQQARLLAVLGTTQENIGEVDAAALSYGQAIALESPGRLNRPAFEAELQLKRAATLNRAGRFAEAAEAGRRAVALREVQSPPDPAGLAGARNALGIVLTNLYDTEGSRRLLLQALAQREAAVPRDVELLAQSNANLALLELAAWRLDEAERRARQAVALSREALRSEINQGRRWTILAMVLAAQGRLPEALDWLQRAEAETRQRFGPQSLSLHRVQRELGPVLLAAGRADEAVAALRQAQAAAQAAGDHRNIYFAVTLSRLARALDAAGQAAEAEATHREAAALAEGVAAPDDIARAEVQLRRAEFLLSRRRAAQAAPLVAAALAAQGQRLANTHPQRQLALRLQDLLALRAGRTIAGA